MSPNGTQPESSQEAFLTQDQIDIIGEVCNVSMGSAATALSSIIGKKVSITSPTVENGSTETIERINRIPSIGVIISYTQGLIGKDILIIRRDDAVKIVKVLIGDESVGDEEFGELHLSAIGEVMNQMMGSAATALSGFIEKSVNISPPNAFILTDENKAEKLSFIYENVSDIVLVRFLFRVEDMLESDIYMIMSHEFAIELVRAMLSNMGVDEMPGAMPVQAAPRQSAPPLPPPEAEPRRAAPVMAAAFDDARVQAAAMSAPVMQTAIRPAVLPDFGMEAGGFSNVADISNFELIQEVPLELSVEVGRARKLVKDVMDFSVGTIIELDKQAGDPVDIVVSGQLIARGEVVVIDESFGVRVTEIMSHKSKGR